MNAITKGGYQDVPMSRRRAQLLAEYAERLATMLENAPDDKDLAEWVQSKIDRAASAIQSAYHYLDQEDDLEKGAGHKYTHRKRVGTDKRGRARYRYYYQEHHGGGITRAKLEAGSAFKLTFRGRRGHFHIESVQGDIVTVKHDGRPNSKPVEMTKAEFRALIKRQHGKALASHTEKLRRQVDKLKRNPTRKRSSLGLALHRLRQAAEKAGVTLPEEYQRKPKKKTAREAVQGQDNFDTMPEVESTGTSQSKTEFREKIEELKRLEDQQQDFTGALYRPQGLTKEQEKDILDKMQAEIAKKRDELTEGFVRPQSSEELETRLSEFLPTFKGLDYNRIEGYRFYVDREHRASLRARIKDLVGTGLNISPANQKNYGLNVAGTFKDLVRLLFALENEAKEETRSPVQSEVLEAVNQSQSFINDLIFNKQGKLTRARNRNKLKGYSDNGARSVAGDIVSETMREVSPHLMNHTNRQRYENQARVNVARVLSESKGLTREEIAVSIETVLRDTAQKTGVLNPPREMILPKRTGEISEFGERLADRETVEIDVSPTPTTARDQLTSTAQEIITEADQDHDERHDEHQSIEQFELGEHTHTKTGVKLFTAKQKGRTDRDEYRRRVEIARKHNGRYERRYVKGFLFKTAEDARNFALEVEGGQVEESAETVTPHEDHPQADNFETMPEVESTESREDELKKEAEAIVSELGKDWEKRESTNRAFGFFEYYRSVLRRMYADSAEKMGELDKYIAENYPDVYKDYKLNEAFRRESRLQEKLKKIREKRLAREVVQGDDNFETMSEVESAEDRTRGDLQSKQQALDLVRRSQEKAEPKFKRRTEESKSADQAVVDAIRQILGQPDPTQDLSARERRRLEEMLWWLGHDMRSSHESKKEERQRARDTIGEILEQQVKMLSEALDPRPIPQTPAPEPDPSPARQALTETADEIMSPSPSALNIDQANAQDTLTENRTRNPESKATDKALIESARELAKTSERGDEIRAAVLDLMNAQQLKRYKRATGETGLRAEDMIEKRRAARERLRRATSGATVQGEDRFDTMPEVETQPKQKKKTQQEAREAQERRLIQQKTFTPEIQDAIDVIKNPYRKDITRSFESHFKTRKDGGIFRMSKNSHMANLADAITSNLPKEITEYDAGMEGLRSLIVDQITKAIEQRETLAELKDRIGAVITKRAQDNAVRRKEQITGRGLSAALREMNRNITTLSGRSHFNSKLRGEREDRSYIGLESIEDQLSIKKRIDETLIGNRFRVALPEEVKEHVAPTARYGYTRAADHATIAFANKYQTVGEIRDNISTIREQMRSTIKGAMDGLTEYLVQEPAALDMIKRSYEKATEQRDTQREKALKTARALAQYTDDPQAHLAEIQELERQSDQAIAEQMEINREFANAYIHEASDLAERVLESTKGEVIDNIMNIKGLNMHEGTLIASVQGRANRKLMARIFNEVFEQVREEIEKEPIGRGENHPRNIAETVKKPSNKAAQFRDDIERIVEEKKARRREEREAKRSKSADNFETMLEGKASEESPSTTPKPDPLPARDQLTETAREVVQGDDNFETMSEVEERIAEPQPTPETSPEKPVRTRGQGRRSDRFIDVGAHVWGSRADKASLNRASLDTMNPKELAKASGRDKVVTWQGLKQEMEEGEEKGHTPSAVILKEAIVKLLPARPFRYQTALTDADGNAVETGKIGDFIDGCDFLMQSLDRCKTMSDIAEFMTEFSFLKDGYEVDIFASREEAQAFLDAEHGGQGRVKYAGAIIERGESRSIYHAMREIDPDKASEFQKMFTALSGVTQNMPRNKQRRRPLAKVLNNAPEIEDMVKGKMTPFVYGLDIGKPFLDAVKKAISLKDKGYDSPEVKEMMTQIGASKQRAPRKKRKQVYKLIRNVGEAARVGGSNTGQATSQTLKDSLNLTNVQYGNWMDEKSREVHTQHCQDAFSDFADILGVSTTDLSLSGRLSIGFGARGKGKANAHYEPSAKIINLTKFAGGGSLAHEWGHFLDNIIAETINVKPSAETQVMISDAFTVDGLWSGVNSVEQGVERKGLVEATSEVMRAILYEPLDRVTEEQVAQAREEQRQHRVMLSELVQQYNRGTMPEDRRVGFRAEYKELKAEQESLRTKASNLYQMQKETPRGNLLRNRNPSQFFRDSDALNNGKNGYWTRPHEMFARAFESYIEDELASQGRVNSYLVSGTRDQYDTESHKGAQPYPQGAQRQKINKAMKAFIDIVREQGWLQKALYQTSRRSCSLTNYRADLYRTIERLAS